MAATTKGLSRRVSALVSVITFDPVDMLGNPGLERCQGFWLCNEDAANIAYLGIDGVTASVGGDDCIPLLPRHYVWVAKPAVNKGTNPTATTLWSIIGATATVPVMVISDSGSWHPYR